MSSEDRPGDDTKKIASTTAVDLATGEAGSLRPGDANEEEFGGRPAYLFVSGAFAAVTLDPTAANLPHQAGEEPWRLEHSFTLGIRDVGPLDINPEPLVLGVKTDGYYMWRPGDPALRRSEAGPHAR